MALVNSCLIVICLFFATGQALAQTSVLLRGQVVDAETQEPIPNAQVGVADNRLGTSTNAEGRFALALPPAYQRGTLTVALLGYRRHSQALPPLPAAELHIALALSPAALGEVTVSGSVLGLVREAVARIPRNYSIRPTQLTGFFRESDNELANGQYRYLGEAVLLVRKTPYTEPENDGEIVIQQSRKVDLQAPNGIAKEGWYAGPFIPHRFDFVHNRLDFINKAHFKNYNYRLTDQTTYNDRPVYVIAFGPKPNNKAADFEGRLYIDQESYAFLAAEWHRTPAGIRHEFISFDSEERAYRVDYQQYAGRWHLKNVWYNTRGKSLVGGTQLRHLSEYLTTAIDTAQGPVPNYVVRAQYRDVFRENSVGYDSAFWKNYTTLLPPEQLRHALRDQDRQHQAERLFAPQAAPKTQSVSATLWKLLSRLRFLPAGGVLALRTTEAEVGLDFAPPGSDFRAQAQRRTPAQQAVAWNSGFFNTNVQFDFTRSLSAYYLTRKVSGRFEGKGVEVGATFEYNFNPRHRPVFGRLGAAYVSQRVGYGFGTFANPDRGLVVAGTKLNADKISVAVQEFTDGWLPRLGLGVEVSHRLEAVADLGLLLPWHRRTELHLAEESGFFLTRNEVDLALPAAGATVLVNQRAAAAPWALGRPLLTVALLYRLR